MRDVADSRQCTQQRGVTVRHKGFDGAVALLAVRVTLLLMLALRGVLITLQTAQQTIDEVILEPVVLMGDERQHMQVAVFIGAADDLKDFRFDDAVGIVVDALMGFFAGIPEKVYSRI